MTYKKLLENGNIVTEEQFNQAIQELPEFEDCYEEYIPSVYFDLYEYLIACYLSFNTEYGYADNINKDEKTLEIYDLSDDESEKVIKAFKDKGWVVINSDYYSLENLRARITNSIKECDDIEILQNIMDSLV